MINRFKKISLICGIALVMFAAFPVFAQNDVKINRQPLSDFGKEILIRVQNGELVPSDNFLIEVEGELDKNGKLDFQKTKYIRTEGNEKIADAAKSAIEAVNDSGVFGYLTQLGAKKMNFIFAQTDEQIYTVINLDLDSEKRAETLNSVFDMALMMSKQNLKNENEKILVNATNVFQNGKTVTIKTLVEKSVGQAMIQRQIEKESARRSKTETNK